MQAKQLNLQKLIKYLETKVSLIQDAAKWSIQGIMQEDYVSILHVLIKIAEMYGKYLELPSHASISVIKEVKTGTVLKVQTTPYILTEVWNTETKDEQQGNILLFVCTLTYLSELVFDDVLEELLDDEARRKEMENVSGIVDCFLWI